MDARAGWLLGLLAVLSALPAHAGPQGTTSLVTRLGVGMTGNDLLTYFPMHPELLCFMACQAQPTCVAFMYMDFNGGECRLKTTLAATTGTNLQRSDIYSVDINGGKMYPWTALPGSTLSSLAVPDLGTCLLACANSTACVAVVYDAPLGNCDLKSVTCKQSACPASGDSSTTESVVVDFLGSGGAARKAVRLAPELGVIIYNADVLSYTYFPELQFMSCLVQCRNNAQCLSIVYVDAAQQCLLKSTTCAQGTCAARLGSTQVDLLDGWFYPGGYATQAKQILSLGNFTLQSCLAQCSRTRGCQSISYFRPLPEECRLQVGVCGTAGHPNCDFAIGSLFDTINLASDYVLPPKPPPSPPAFPHPPPSPTRPESPVAPPAYPMYPPSPPSPSPPSYPSPPPPSPDPSPPPPHYPPHPPSPVYPDPQSPAPQDPPAPHHPPSLSPPATYPPSPPPVPPVGLAGRLSIRGNATIVGYDLARLFPVSGFEACLGRCSTQVDGFCVAFSFSASTGLCLLGNATIGVAGAVQAGTMSMEMNDATLRSATKLLNHDIGSPVAIPGAGGFAACLALCADTPTCKSVVVSKAEALCYLKSATCGVAQCISAAAFSTVLKGASEWVTSNNTILVDSTVSEGYTQQPELSCISACEKTPTCKAAVFDTLNGQCLLKERTCSGSGHACLKSTGTNVYNTAGSILFSGYANFVTTLSSSTGVDLATCVHSCSTTPACVSLSYSRPHPATCLLHSKTCSSSLGKTCQHFTGVADTLDIAH